MIKLYVGEVEDEYSRDNFRKLERELREQPLLKGKFKFFEITFSKAVTNLKYPHNLGFAPKDILQTSLIGAGTVTWNYVKFDRTNLDVTTSGACVVRGFFGSYEETNA